ncbi:MAG: Uma2 family endonuclease [Gammaproteobacteria bacterium]|nr:Uma2 family endonuclease [Gammaproteobacteria bacterium]
MPTVPEPQTAGKLHGPARRTAAPPFAQRTADASARARVYPESDGKPMAESDLHGEAMVDARQPLKDHYAHRDDVYVGGNMMMYYVEGNPKRWISPDVFVAFGPSRLPLRPVWKTWEEAKLADFVLEVTSETTRATDEGSKRRLYQRLGVTEYWQFDPTGDYLDPILKGRRLAAGGNYELIPLATTTEGLLYGESSVLALHLCLDEGRLRLFDPAAGEFLLSHREHVVGHAEERRARKAAEAEIERLKRQLARR